MADKIGKAADIDFDELIPDKPIVKVYKPYPLSGLRKEASRHTICDELRKVYEDIEAGNLERAKLGVRIAMRMGKAMGTKLKEYNARISREMWPVKSDLEKGRVRLDQTRREARKDGSR